MRNGRPQNGRPREHDHTRTDEHDQENKEIQMCVQINSMDTTIASLIGKKGYPKPPKKNTVRPEYALDPRYEEIISRSHEMDDEEIYQAMVESGLIADYPLLSS